MRTSRKTLACVTVFTSLVLLVSGCENGSVQVSSETAKDLACATARTSNAAGAVSDDVRKNLAHSIAESVKDETIKDLARRIEESDTPEKLRAAYTQLIDKACGPEKE